MESFANALRAQLSDYIDMEKLFAKLEEEKSLQRIHNVLHLIIADSAKSVLKGTIEKQIAGFDEGRIKNAYEKNLALFKNKFIVILQMMVENIFTYDLLKEMPKEIIEEAALPTEQRSPEWRNSTTKSTRESEIAESHRFTPKNRRPAHSPKKDKKLKQVIPSPKKASSKDEKFVLRKKSVEKKKRLDSTANTTVKNWEGSSPFSKSASLSNTILSPSPINKSLITNRGERSFSKTPRSTFKLALEQSSSNNSNPPTFTLRRNKNNFEPVQSEFNHIKGPSTFRTARIESWIDTVARTDSPGPGAYSPGQDRGSRSVSMGKSPRKSWIDEVARTDSPGPGRYNPKLGESPSSVKFNKGVRKSWIDEVARTDSTGPGAYTPRNQNRTRSLSMNRSLRKSWIDEVARNDSPGPAKYTPKSERNSPAHSMGRSPRKCWVDEVANNIDSPGPAAHYGSMHYLSK